MEKALILLKNAIKYLGETKPTTITFDQIKEEYNTGVSLDLPLVGFNTWQEQIQMPYNPL